MLDVSAKKLQAMGLADRAKIIEADLNNQTFLADLGQQFDLIISLHNVMSFLVDPLATIKSFGATLVPGGQLALVIPNLYHAAYFSALNRDLGEMKRVQDTGRTRMARPAGWSFGLQPSGL